MVLPLGILLALFFYFGPYIESLIFDLAQHYFLVDEIMKHDAVRPVPIPNIATMAIYPPSSHWMAAFIGWIGGSGLVDITLVTFFVALIRSCSLIGWEIIENYFHPQLVADVIYLGTLLWLVVILHSFTTPVRPIVEAINYTNGAARFVALATGLALN